MALGKRRPAQQPLFVPTAGLAALRPHPYFDAVNKVLDAHGFDRFVEAECASFYKGDVGRPGLPPGVYFRCLMVGYLEGIDSERGIAWRCADSNSLKLFLGYAIDQSPPDHSTLSRTRRLIDLQTHAEVFRFLLKVLANHNLIGGKTVGVDGTTLEANAAMRSIVRRDGGEGYAEFLTRLAEESGIDTPTREDLAKLDRARKSKGSNDDWHNPNDPDAKITRMKDGTTHLAHKAEHAVDLGEDAHGAVLAVNVADAAVGDTNTIADTLAKTADHLQAVADDKRVASKIDAHWLFLERSFAHCYETGAMRRLHLRGRDNIAKRLLVHASGFNLGLLMRVGYGLTKPRGLPRAAAACVAAMWAVWAGLRRLPAAPLAHGRRPAEPLRLSLPFQPCLAA